jgi:hypothetical protein
MCFSTRNAAPFMSSPRRSATIAIVVRMQVPSAVPTRSVGENDSPRPMLSAGASVAIAAPDGPCRASHRRPPR